MEDVRLFQQLRSGRVLKVLNTYNLTGRPFEWRLYKRIILRLMSNPSRDVQKLILERRKKLGDRNKLIGVHVRCGGRLADMPERTTIMSQYQVKMVPLYIKQMVNKLKITPVIYLSTDSSYAESYLRNVLRKYRVVTINDFKRGHTTNLKVSEGTIKRALMDMYLVAQGNAIIYTKKSGFSGSCFGISSAKRAYVMHSLLFLVCLIE